MQTNESRTDRLPLDGIWKFDEDNATFEHEPGEPTDSRHPLGVALSALHAPRGGCLSADITLPENLEGEPAARLLVGNENANVFYEVGYAHARETPTILLARRGEQLPFYVSGYRTIFYENTISGKDDVASDLRRHLAHIR